MFKYDIDILYFKNKYDFKSNIKPVFTSLQILREQAEEWGKIQV